MEVLIIDDQPVFRETLAELVGKRFAGASVRLAKDLEAGLALLAQRRSDLIIADLSSPGLQTEAGLKLLIERAESRPVLAMDGRRYGRNLDRARRAGTRGYLTKTSTRALMDAAIALVAAGGAYHPIDSDGEEDQDSGPAKALSPRQLQVLRGLTQGKSNREIAADLGIAEATVKLHVHAILNATGARNRTEAALLGREAHGPLD